MPKCQSYSNFSQKWRNFAESGHKHVPMFQIEFKVLFIPPNRKLSFPQNNN